MNFLDICITGEDFFFHINFSTIWQTFEELALRREVGKSLFPCMAVKTETFYLPRAAITLAYVPTTLVLNTLFNFPTEDFLYFFSPQAQLLDLK